MKRNKYLAPQHTIKAGVGPNGRPADGWWYGEEKILSVYISANDGSGCHWAKIPRRSIEAWLRATDEADAVNGVCPQCSKRRNDGSATVSPENNRE